MCELEPFGEFITSYECMDRKGIELFDEGLLAINQVCLEKYAHFAFNPNHSDYGELISDYILENAGEDLHLIAITMNNTIWRVQNLVFLDGFSDGRFLYGFRVVDY